MAKDRVTTNKLYAKLLELNMVLNRPVTLVAADTKPGAIKYNVGHLHLDNMNPGDGRTFVLEEVTRNNSSYRPMGNTRYNLHDMYVIIEALVKINTDHELLRFPEPIDKKTAIAYRKAGGDPNPNEGL